MIDRPILPKIAGDQKAPIFLYSGFRASSTWMWSRFRTHKSLLCYYEPFNEQLGSLAPDTIGEARPDGWRSHHPKGAPYTLEYAGLLGEGGGVLGFPSSLDRGQLYIATSDAAAPLDEDVANYVKGLINHAYARGRTPLLACTRLLAQTRGLKLAFGGYHILLIRNLFQQWNSYAGQARFGNWYFLHTLYETLGLAERDPIIGFLRRFFPKDACSSLEAWVTPQNFDRVFCYFVGFHLYFLTLARRSADIVVDANALADPDSSYRHAIVAKIASDTGIELDLDDASEHVDFPLHPMQDRQACIILINEIASTIKSSCHATEDEQAFIDDLIADLWSKQTTFQLQTAGAFEYLAQIDTRNDAQISRITELDARLAEREAAIAALQEAESVRTAELQARLYEWEATTGAMKDAHSVQTADLEALIAERDAAIAALQEAAVAEREAGIKALNIATRTTDERVTQLASAEHTITTIRDALAQAVEAQAMIRDQLDVERARFQRFESDHVAALTQIADLQAMLAEARHHAMTLRSRIVQLECGIANVDAININLAGRIARTPAMGRALEREPADDPTRQE